MTCEEHRQAALIHIFQCIVKLDRGCGVETHSRAILNLGKAAELIGKIKVGGGITP